MARLLATQGALAGRSFPIVDVCVIGRDPKAQVPLSESTASRRHTQITGDGKRFRLKDLGSHNGTYLNGKQVREAGLSHGDTLTIGDHAFLFLEDAAQDPTQAQSGPRRFQIDSTVSDFEMVGESPAFVAALAQAEKLARSDAPVLLTGETGSGKELFARWIHRSSKRSHGPFVAVNCAAIPEALFEAELFGAEAGAYTGATDRRPGKFGLAEGGTLFLDEIGELPLALQPKLLRAVQERAFYRVGGAREIRADVRIVAATNRDLTRSMASGSFREDLYHRLSTLPLRVPPLRERREDIAALVHHVAGRTARRLGKPPVEIPSETLLRLEGYAWPGNVRELQNVIERAVVLLEGGRLEPFHVDLPAGPSPPQGAAGGFSLAAAEREAVRKALAETGGKKGEAAKLLGISWPTLRRKMREHGLDALS